MKREAIVLAGGLGTRLRSVLGNLPKPMAPVGGKPFLEYLLRYLSDQAFGHVVLSVGHRHETITEYFGSSFEDMRLSYEVETAPLGTGGALRASSRHIETESYAVFNGDTLFRAEMDAAFAAHERENADITIVVKEMERSDRYGAMAVDADLRITGFAEKRRVDRGFINGGVYVMKRSVLQHPELEKRFSLEKDLFEASLGKLRMLAFPSDAYFVDIGVPDDYERAQREVPLIFGMRGRPGAADLGGSTAGGLT